MSFSRKEWRMFDRCKAGLLMTNFRNRHKRVAENIRFLTLTTSPVTVEGLNDKQKLEIIQKNFKVLKMRLDREYGYNLGEYFSCRTLEGYGVMHILFKGDYVKHSDIVNEWNEIHGSFIVDIRPVNLDEVDKTTFYLLTQYLTTKQGRSVIFGYSRNWAYKGFLNDMVDLKELCLDFDDMYLNGFDRVCVPVDYKRFINSWKYFLEFKVMYNMGLRDFIDFYKDEFNLVELWNN